jgi:hypothetical protein
VLLPDPDGPTTAQKAPFVSEKLMSRSTGVGLSGGPYCFPTPDNLSMKHPRRSDLRGEA